MTRVTEAKCKLDSVANEMDAKGKIRESGPDMGKAQHMLYVCSYFVSSRTCTLVALAVASTLCVMH